MTGTLGPDFYSRAGNEANVWNRYLHFRTHRVTTDKLAELLEELAAENTFVLAGEDSYSPSDMQEVLQVTHVGGRDWVVITGNVGP